MMRFLLVLTSLLTVAAPALGVSGDPAAAGTALRPPAPVATVLRYEAFMAGARVGEATVTVDIDGAEYRVRGSARSNGLLRGFSRWRNRFFARGRVGDDGREPQEFGYVERDSDKRREVQVRDGLLTVVKNGRQRPQRPSPPGPDVISALFVEPRCADQTLHTGRHVYRLSRLDQGAHGCRYRVVDDDDESFEVELALTRHQDLLVPKRITVHGWLTGWIELVEAQPAAAPAVGGAAATAP